MKSRDWSKVHAGKSSSDNRRTLISMSINLETLRGILDALPFGIVAYDGDSIIYSNSLGQIYSASGADNRDIVVNGRIVRSQNHVVAVGSLPFRVSVTTDITEQRALEDDLFRRAYFDELTGLPNNHLIETTVGSLINSNADVNFALSVITIDNFKNISDNHGRMFGNQIICKISDRLSGSIGPRELIARTGADEFTLLVSLAESAESVVDRTNGIIAKISQPCFVDGIEILLSASAGVSLHPSHGRSYQALYTNADRAKDTIKRSTKGEVQLYTPSLDDAAKERMQFEQRVLTAVRDRRLCCAYQPKVNFRTDEIVGVEVLLRWIDEDGETKSPGNLIRVATDFGIMNEVTTLILEETISNIDSINDAFGPFASISINLAANQASDAEFLKSVISRIRNTGRADRFILELTEEALIAGENFQHNVLPLIREAGIRVSIDDFGVGYSSLSMLADITADEIKVDRSLISGIQRKPRNQNIIKAIESLASNLDMAVVVEGVESIDELEYLQSATWIRVAQGYFFAKPMLINDIVKTPDRLPERIIVPSRIPLFRCITNRNM